MSDTCLQFDCFEMQLADRRVLCGGREVALRGRAFDVLAALAQRPGRLVNKDELLEQVWPGLVVEEGNIAVQIAAIRKALFPELIATVPGHGYRLTATPIVSDAALAQAAASGASLLTERPSVAVAAPALFGREDDMARVRAALQMPGCVTVTGTGGVGKTALARALYVGWDLGPATWIDLSVWPADDDLQPALSASLGVHLEASAGDDSPLGAPLDAVLGGAGRLLVLDNAEHLLEPLAALLPRWLAALPSLHLLVTSQAALRVSGERLESLAPLALPADQADEEEVSRSSAVALFLARLRALDSRRPWAGDALPLVRQLCVRLDGLPLAMEMAAARVPLLGLQGVLDAVDQRFALLRLGRRDSPARHQSLLAALDWSFSLLDPEDQQLFSALGVFAGSFTLNQAVAVAGKREEARWEVIDRLAVLVERSLLSVGPEDPPRYRLLETLRAYALQQLQSDGREQLLRGRHAQAMLDLVRAADETPEGPLRDAKTEQVLQDMGQVREAFRWSLQHDHPTALGLSARGAGLVELSAWRNEVFGWLRQCEPWVGTAPDTALRALWWRRYARLLYVFHDPRAVAAAAEATRLARSGNNPLALFWALAVSVQASATATASAPAATREQASAWANELAQLLNSHPDWPPEAEIIGLRTRATLCSSIGDFEGVLRHRQTEAALARRSGLKTRAAVADLNVGWTLNRLGRHAEALDAFRSYLDGAPPMDFNTAFAHVHAVRSLILMDRLDEALAASAAALAASRQVHWLEITGVMALLAAKLGRTRTAALLLGHARQAYASRGLPLPDAPLFDYCQAAERLQAQLEPGLLARLMAHGAMLDAESADQLLFASSDANALSAV